MTGTIYGIPLSQPLDINSKVLSGCLLYLYSAGTTTPVDSFSDFLLTQINPWPLEADSAGRIPEFWLPDGAYRARLTDASAILVYDRDNIQAIGPSTGTPVGPGIDPTSIRMTGDFFWLPVDTTRSGSVRANGRTIGSVSSGATERANADTQPLYEFLWNNFADAIAPVSGGRGGSALIDWSANKAIGTPDMRARLGLGLDTMGNSAAGIITDGTPTSPGTTGGSERPVLGVTHLPSYNLGFSLTAAGHTHPVSIPVSSSGATGNVGLSLSTGSTTAGVGAGVGVLNSAALSLGASAVNVSGTVSGSTSSASAGVTGTISSGGGGNGINTTTPYMLGTWYIKLTIYGMVAVGSLHHLIGSMIA